MGIFVIFLLGKLETWFWCQTPCFLAWGITWDHFQTPQICLGGQLAISASQISAIWDKFITVVLKEVETCFWCLFQVFWHDKLIGTILRHLRCLKCPFSAMLSPDNQFPSYKSQILALSALSPHQSVYGGYDHKKIRCRRLRPLKYWEVGASDLSAFFADHSPPWRH